MSAVVLTPQDVATVLLGLDLLTRFAQGEQAKARRRGNLVTAATMQAMLEHIEDLRTRLRDVP
mgnify:CR=1 FL=1